MYITCISYILCIYFIMICIFPIVFFIYIYIYIGLGLLLWGTAGTCITWGRTWIKKDYIGRTCSGDYGSHDAGAFVCTMGAIHVSTVCVLLEAAVAKWQQVEKQSFMIHTGWHGADSHYCAPRLGNSVFDQLIDGLVPRCVLLELRSCSLARSSHKAYPGATLVQVVWIL